MIPKKTLAAAATALVLALSAPAWGHGSAGYGPGMMGPAWGPAPYGPGMGPGMMWQGGPMGAWMPHHGMMGPGWGPGQMGPGQMGPGHMGPRYMGPGYMGPGYMGPGYMGPGYGAALREDLGADDVRAMLERRLAFHGNPRLKVGEVTERDEDTIVADIVTQDGSLVQRFEIDRHRGFWRQAE